MVEGRFRAMEKPSPALAPRAPVESRPAAEPRTAPERPAAATPQSIERPVLTGPAPSVDRGAETSDGSAAVDWLLNDRR